MYGGCLSVLPGAAAPRLCCERFGGVLGRAGAHADQPPVVIDALDRVSMQLELGHDCGREVNPANVQLGKATGCLPVWRSLFSNRCC